MSTTNPGKRFPDWKKVFVAILEKQIETVLGENAIDEIKQPHLQKELNEKLGSIYDAVEKQFIELIPNEEIRIAVLSLPLASLPSLKQAFGEFFQQPQSDKLKVALKNQLMIDYPHLPIDQIDSAVQLYIKILHNELVPLSEEFQRMSLVYSVAQISDHTKQLDVITSLLTELVTQVKNNSKNGKPSNYDDENLFKKDIHSTSISKSNAPEPETKGVILQKKNIEVFLKDGDIKSVSNELKKGARIRFLDALDSARFSSQTSYENSRLLSVLYVKAQFFFTLVSGDSIVVSENQFFDSLGFIETFDELYLAAKEARMDEDLPIKVALRDNKNDVYQVVAKHMGNDNFELTLWKDLKTERRTRWADSIRLKQKPDTEIVSIEENRLLNKLWTALGYFTPDRCVSAENIPDEFYKRIKNVIELKDEDIDDLHTGIHMEINQRKYFTNKSETEAAKEIRDVLSEIQEKVGKINNRTLIRRELAYYENEELREGVIELTDGIYNQTLGIATKAMLIQSSTFPPQINKYVTAGYSLSTYIQDISNKFNNYVNWEIFSFDYFENLEGLEDPRRKKDLILILEAARENTPWIKLIEMRGKSAWQASLQRFQDNLSKLQAIEKNLLEGSLTGVTTRKELGIKHIHYQNQLKKNWAQHIKNVNKILGKNNYWKITPSELMFKHPDYNFSILISYSFLKTKFDIEGDKEYHIWRTSPSYKGRMDDRFDSAR